eukprot:CFRG5066T1
MGELKVTQLSTNANSLTEGQSSKAAEDSTSSQITLIIIVCCTSVGIIFLIIVGWFLCRRYYKRRLRGNGMTAEDKLPGWNPNSAAIHSNDGAIHASFLKDKLLRLSAEGAKRPLTPGDTLGCGYVVKAGASATSLVNFFFTLNGEIVCFKDDISGGDMTNMYACVGSDCDAELSYNFRGGFKCLAVSHFMHSAKKGDSMNTSFQQFSSVHSIPTYETEGEQ